MNLPQNFSQHASEINLLFYKRLDKKVGLMPISDNG